MYTTPKVIATFTGIKCYYDGEDVTHLVKLTSAAAGDKIANELSHLLPFVQDKQEFIPSQNKQGKFAYYMIRQLLLVCAAVFQTTG